MSRFQFVDDHRGAYGVKRLCRVLGVNRSSYYKWLDGAEARLMREQADEQFAARIRAVHGETGGAYGSPRVTAELREAGMVVNEKKVARVMRKFSITGIRLRRKVRTTVPEPSATPVADLFGRDFTAAEPGVKYMGDITYLPVGDGRFLYLATVLDCFSRRVVGYSIADHMHTELVADALRMARDVRGSLEDALFHSDHGAEYASKDFAALCKELGVTQSMGAVGTERGQRRVRVLPRLAQARDPPRSAPLQRHPLRPTDRVPLAHALTNTRTGTPRTDNSAPRPTNTDTSSSQLYSPLPRD